MLFSALISLGSTVFSVVGAYFLDYSMDVSTSAFTLLTSLVPAFFMVILLLLATLNAYGMFKSIVAILIATALKITGMYFSTLMSALTSSYYLTAEATFFDSIASSGLCFLYLAIIITVAVNGIPSRKKNQ